MIQMLEGNRPSLVDLVAARIRDGSMPWDRRDPYSIGLVFEGGGTRAARITGMAGGLLGIGAENAFDNMYGVSSGAIVMDYFVGGQVEAADILSKDINNLDFFNHDRFLPWFISEITGLRRGKLKPVIDIPYLTHGVMRTKRPLKTRRIIESEIPLNSFVVDALKAETIRYQKYDSGEQILDLRHWGARVTVWGGMPLVSGSQHLTDGGGIVSGLPLEQAMAENDYVLVLSMRPGGSWDKQVPTSEKMVPHLLLGRYPALAKRFKEGERAYIRALDTLQEARNNGGLVRGVVVDAIYPNLDARVMQAIEIDGEALRREVESGFLLTLAKFGSQRLPIRNEIANRLLAA